MDWRAVLILCLEALLALWFVYTEGLMKTSVSAVICVFLTALAFTLRGLCLSYKTLDYIDFLSKWVDFFRINGGFSALKYSVGNYNVPYLYFLALFSYSDVNDLYLIKELSILFDVLLAWSGMKLAGIFIKSPWRRIAVFFTLLLLPTVILNGALWGQCDSTYAALALLGIYLALDDRPVMSMACMAISFGFKLQAVFVLPVTVVLWIQGKYNWKHFLVFPATYILLVLPAVFAGRPFVETLTLYLSQTGSIGGGLNYNSPSIFAVVQNVADEAAASKIAVAAAFMFMLILLAIVFIYRKRLNNRTVVFAAALFAVGIPFLLPHMHDRYFFVADILTVVLAFSAPEFAVVPIMTQFASLLGYHAYLKMRYLLMMYWGAYALIVVLLLLVIGFVGSLRESSPPDESSMPL